MPHVCVKVPKPGEPQRVLYNQCETREDWVKCVLGDEGVYAGRPKNDGGWYQSPTVKAGSMFANPFSLKEYSLDESLMLFRGLVAARIAEGATTDAIIDLLPPAQRTLARRRFSGGSEKASVGRSVAHLELSVVGEPFRCALRALRGRRIGCFCEPSDPCHAKVLAEMAEELGAEPVANPSRKRKRD
mmetsp:Transcript_114926/g.245365  ORF Transcript_114926/g.245365 Transcript_114926/m.245365 type:complete len:187 (-) Transcript_114926:43-603(-)